MRNKKILEPTSMDFLHVVIERINNPDYMIDNPQFSKKVMNERLEHNSLEMKKIFERKYLRS